MLLATGCSSVGAPVAGAPAHHREHGFANVDQAQAHAGGWTRVSFFISRMWGATFSPRTANLPRVASDLDTIRANRDAVTVT